VESHRCTYREQQRNLRRAISAAIGTAISTAVGSAPARRAPLLALNEVRLAKCVGEEAVPLRDTPCGATCGGCGGDRRIVSIPTSGAESLSLRAPVNKDAVVGALHQSVGRAEGAQLIAQPENLVELFK
jgi:hypothetical protein